MRVLEVWVVLVDDDLCDNGYDLSLDVGEPVPEGLLDHVADLALGHGAEDDEGLRGDEVPCLILLYREVADLGSVAVRDGDLVALAGDLGDLAAGDGDIPHLLLGGPPLIGLLNGVTTQRDHDSLIHS